ncbi:alpha-N-arabinofuranosidase [Tessaracoccus defluvii]|uniref:non-reducing end alpha-L-arabinofuranosidase n=1 Tax=Tessaracoccus defluvii TaxID=1285901 RepID=A0A7H0H653_9ACTN|nr:alpha-L-arabinofuranosidase C-terminal domain-containing protein [Tessaracoccus defluvii]QNP56019.1 alpha-N-arabinofuranosidase [Tessaracoccus defluvii]
MTHTDVVINLDLTGPTVSRHLYGHFAEHLGRCIYGGFWVGEDSPLPNTRGIRTDIVEALRAIQIPNLRWPGGCFADDYHWRDGIGPSTERARMVNSHWGDVVEDNSFGTHEFMDLCDMLGADAYICGNVGSGTVREMSEWVEYLTRGDDSPMATLRRQNGRDEPWRVPFFGIGNEPWGCGGNMRGDAYADLARQYATYARNHGENTLYRIAAGASDSDYEWTESLMKALGCIPCGDRPAFEAVSFHYYSFAGQNGLKGSATDFNEDDYFRTIASAAKVEELLTRHSTVMDRYDPQRRIGLVLDEWGTWWDVEPGTNPGFLYQQNSLRDAMVAAIHFDAFHRHADRLVMANIAQTVNVLQAMVLTDPETSALVLTPTYHVFEMNTGHHDAATCDVRVRNAPTRNWNGTELTTVSASATTTGTSALVSLTNLDSDGPVELVLDLRGRSVKSWHGRILTAETVRAHNTPAAPDAVAPRAFTDLEPVERGLRVTLPPHSYVTVALDLA